MSRPRSRHLGDELVHLGEVRLARLTAVHPPLEVALEEATRGAAAQVAVESKV